MFDPKASLKDRQRAVSDLIADLSADDRPILVGPWRSELGFEALYWTPFLKWIAGKVPGFHDRAVTVTRGGAGVLYLGIAGRAVDLYTLRSVTEVRRENLYDYQIRTNATTQKQVLITEWDTSILAQAAGVAACQSYHTLHPAWLYWALAPWWEEQCGLAYLLGMTDYTPIPKVTLDGDLPLPPSYAAMKFYARHTFPYPDDRTATVVKRVVGKVASQVPVVSLATGDEYDEHSDVTVTHTAVSRLPDVAPEQNLMVQAAVLGKAAFFVGTYGGTSQLALRMGIPSVSLYATWGGTSHAHLTLSSYLSKLQKTPYLVTDFDDLTLLGHVVA